MASVVFRFVTLGTVRYSPCFVMLPNNCRKPKMMKIIKAITTNNILGADENREKRKEMITAKAFEPTEFAFERAIGKNDSLYSNFTELIALTKRKVGRIVIIQDGKRLGFATGFMVSANLLLTNWHVFKTADMATESEIHFQYEYDSQSFLSLTVPVFLIIRI